MKPLADDDSEITLDEVATRIRRALREIGSIREVGDGADVHLLEAEKSLRKVLRAIGASQA